MMVGGVQECYANEPDYDGSGETLVEPLEEEPLEEEPLEEEPLEQSLGRLFEAPATTEAEEEFRHVFLRDRTFAKEQK